MWIISNKLQIPCGSYSDSDICWFTNLSTSASTTSDGNVCALANPLREFQVYLSVSKTFCFISNPTLDRFSRISVRKFYMNVMLHHTHIYTCNLYKIECNL